jgi:hypothetical protein
MRSRITAMAVVAGLAGVLLALGAAPASAHEERKIGSYTVEVGFADEPAYTGAKNSVLMVIHDASDKPVVDLGDTLKVDISTAGKVQFPSKDPTTGQLAARLDRETQRLIAIVGLVVGAVGLAAARVVSRTEL